MIIRITILYLILISLITALIFASDKRRAQKHQWRVPERNLLLFCMLGGSPGALLAMYSLHHKTQHAKFTLGVPLILVMQIILIYWLCYLS